MIYSPSEVCETFEIAKSTLYRWEREGKIPPAPRKISGEREYKQTHIQKIAEIKLDELTREHQRALKIGDKDRMSQILKAKSQIKALYLDDLLGLRELAEYDTIPNKIIKDLLIKASDLDPQENLFKGIVGLVYRRCNS